MNISVPWYMLPIRGSAIRSPIHLTSLPDGLNVSTTTTRGQQAQLINCPCSFYTRWLPGWQVLPSGGHSPHSPLAAGGTEGGREGCDILTLSLLSFVPSSKQGKKKKEGSQQRQASLPAVYLPLPLSLSPSLSFPPHPAPPHPSPLSSPPPSLLLPSHVWWPSQRSQALRWLSHQPAEQPNHVYLEIWCDSVTAVQRLECLVSPGREGERQRGRKREERDRVGERERERDREIINLLCRHARCTKSQHVSAWSVLRATQQQITFIHPSSRQSLENYASKAICVDS